MSLFLFITYQKGAGRITSHNCNPSRALFPKPPAQPLNPPPVDHPETCFGFLLRQRGQKAEVRFVRVANFNYLSISLSTRISRAYPSSSFGVSR